MSVDDKDSDLSRNTSLKKGHGDRHGPANIYDDELNDTESLWIDLNHGPPSRNNDDIVIDPILLAQGKTLAAAIAGIEGGEITEAAEDATFDCIIDADAHSGHPNLLAQILYKSQSRSSTASNATHHSCTTEEMTNLYT